MTDSTEFIEELQVTDDGGVVKKMIKQGEDGPLPNEGEKCLVHYEGRLEDGSIFDSSYDRGDPLELKVGTGMVI